MTVFKDWESYSDKELLVIYEEPEKWEKFFEYQCALQSIPFLPEYPGEEPEKYKGEPNVPTYSVGNIIFEKKADAEKIFDLINGMPLLQTNYNNGSIYTIKPCTSQDTYEYPKFNIKNYYSQQLYNEIKLDIKSYEERKSIWEKALKLYKKIKANRKDLADDIYEIVDIEQNLRNEYVSMEKTYRKYFSLAGEDKTVALGFLKSSHPNFYENFPEFFELTEEKDLSNE